jgi:hypothetical protein
VAWAIDNFADINHRWADVHELADALQSDFATVVEQDRTRRGALEILARIPKPAWHLFQTRSHAFGTIPGENALHIAPLATNIVAPPSRDFAIMTQADAEQLRQLARRHRENGLHPKAGWLDNKRIGLRVHDAQGRTLHRLGHVVAAGREPRHGHLVAHWRGTVCHIHKEPIIRISEGTRYPSL